MIYMRRLFSTLKDSSLCSQVFPWFFIVDFRSGAAAFSDPAAYRGT